MAAVSGADVVSRSDSRPSFQCIWACYSKQFTPAKGTQVKVAGTADSAQRATFAAVAAQVAMQAGAPVTLPRRASITVTKKEEGGTPPPTVQPSAQTSCEPSPVSATHRLAAAAAATAGSMPYLSLDGRAHAPASMVDDEDDDMCIRLLKQQNPEQNFRGLSEKGRQNASVAGRRLSVVKLPNTNLTLQSLRFLALRAPSVERIHMRAEMLSDADCDAFFPLKKLKVLHLEGCSRLSHQALPYLARCTELQRIVLNNLPDQEIRGQVLSVNMNKMIEFLFERVAALQAVMCNGILHCRNAAWVVLANERSSGRGDTVCVLDPHGITNIVVAHDANGQPIVPDDM